MIKWYGHWTWKRLYLDCSPRGQVSLPYLLTIWVTLHVLPKNIERAFWFVYLGFVPKEIMNVQTMNILIVMATLLFFSFCMWTFRFSLRKVARHICHLSSVGGSFFKWSFQTDNFFSNFIICKFTPKWVSENNGNDISQLICMESANTTQYLPLTANHGDKWLHQQLTWQWKAIVLLADSLGQQTNGYQRLLPHPSAPSLWIRCYVLLKLCVWCTSVYRTHSLRLRQIANKNADLNVALREMEF